MSRVVLCLLAILSASHAIAATFGTVTTIVGSVSDIVLDEERRRVYLVNSTSDRLEVYSLNPIRQVATIRTDSLPLSAAMSTDKTRLYITCHNASSLNVVDLDRLTVVARPSLPARPEGIAIGNDDRALITTIGTGVGNTQNTLIIYDPNRNGTIDNVVVVPPAPTTPPGAPPAGRAFLSNRSQLVPSQDGSIIVGVNIPNGNQRAVFVYEVASGTVLRSRIINNISSVLSISPDGKKFMCGLNLFDLETLEVLAQQNLANAPYPIAQNTNFNTQQNQGGSVFTPDGQTIYSAFNIAPIQNPVARPNVGQLMINDPDNLLIKTAYQMPENLAGKMVITSDGATVYAISESGFTSIPVGTADQNPIVALSSDVLYLANDQCGVTADMRRQQIQLLNTGRGRFTASAQVLQLTPTGPVGLGGIGGAGGGLPGGGAIIVIGPGIPGLPGAPTAPVLPGGGVGATTNPATNNAITQTAPTLRMLNNADGPALELNYNAANSRTLGTVSPVHDFLIQSNEAINIPPRLRVFQNNRDAEARADVRAIQVGVSANEALEDILYDGTRNRVYVANSGMNRVEVFDARSKAFMPAIKVGQLPRSIAISPDGNTLYVANTGGESISVIDLATNTVTGRLRFPPLPFNATAALVTPSIIAATQRGLLVIMNNGSIWRSVGNELVPRTVSTIIGTANLTQPRTMAATPNGEYAMILAGNGFVYLYDAAADDFVQGRQIFTNPIQGYFGPVSAGPNGRYFLANGTVLNPALTPVASAGSVQVAAARPGQAAQTTPRPVSAVAALGATTYVRFAQPVRVQANNPLVNEAPLVEVADTGTGNAMRQAAAVEGPISIVTGNARANVGGRQIAVDPAGTTAYMITTSGLSIVPLDPVAVADRPVVTPNGITNVANAKPTVAPGSLVAIAGRNLGESGSTGTGDALPTVLGGVCVTLNNQPLPLMTTSSGQITAQIPPTLAAGRYPLMVRNLDRKASSLAPAMVTVSKYAPAVVVDPENKQAAIYHPDGAPVTKQNPTTRDERLTMFAVGLGATKGARIVAGQPTPADPPATTDDVQVYFGDPRMKQAAIIVEQSVLVPGLVGVYQIDLYVPGDRIRGENLDVTIRIGGVDSPTKGDLDPRTFVK